MEIKDVVLKKGDIIYIKNSNLDISYTTINKLQEGLTVKACNEYLLPRNRAIVKVERPIKYETIYEAPKQILDKKEKEWLENFLRPFINARIRVIKSAYFDYVGEYGYEELTIMIEDCEVNLPPFNKDTMYKGMELDKEYTIKELGLFE